MTLRVLVGFSMTCLCCLLVKSAVVNVLHVVSFIVPGGARDKEQLVQSARILANAEASKLQDGERVVCSAALEVLQVWSSPQGHYSKISAGITMPDCFRLRCKIKTRYWQSNGGVEQMRVCLDSNDAMYRRF